MTKACVPGAWPRLLVTVTVVAFVMVVLVDFAIEVANEKEAPTVTSASAIKSIPVLISTLAPSVFVIVVSDDEPSEVLTVRPCEMAKEQEPPVQDWVLATSVCLPAEGYPSPVVVILQVLRSRVLSRVPSPRRPKGLPSRFPACWEMVSVTLEVRCRGTVLRQWVRLRNQAPGLEQGEKCSPVRKISGAEIFDCEEDGDLRSLVW